MRIAGIGISRLSRCSSLVLLLLTVGCGVPNSSFQIPFAGIVIPQFTDTGTRYVTTDEVTLRSDQEDESKPVAVLPRGTPIVPIGIVGAECDCWKVSSSAGSGWLYTRYITSENTEPTEALP